MSNFISHYSRHWKEQEVLVLREGASLRGLYFFFKMLLPLIRGQRAVVGLRGVYTALMQMKAGRSESGGYAH